MIKPGLSYVRDELLPRLRTVVLSTDALAGALSGWGIARCVDSLPIAGAQVGAIAGIVLTYAAIALGFCVAGMTIVLTLPSGGFARTLATTQLPGRKTNGYSDLMFVFSWTAIVHWLSIGGVVAVLVFCDSERTIGSASSGWPGRVALGAISGIVVYSMCRFLIALVTLSEVGQVYMTDLRKVRRDESDR